jgi:hypothetical protein
MRSQDFLLRSSYYRNNQYENISNTGVSFLVSVYFMYKNVSLVTNLKLKFVI